MEGSEGMTTACSSSLTPVAERRGVVELDKARVTHCKLPVEANLCHQASFDNKQAPRRCSDAYLHSVMWWVLHSLWAVIYSMIDDCSDNSSHTLAKRLHLITGVH